MRKIIAKAEYDTENAEFISKRTYGNFGEDEGYEECLYRRGDGKYFLYVSGGERSPYPKEDIKRISAEKVFQNRYWHITKKSKSFAERQSI